MSYEVLKVHLDAAEEFYRQDRLAEALDAYASAMRDCGWVPGGWAGFYNEVVWEKAARENGETYQLTGDLSLEIPRSALPRVVAEAKSAALEARHRVQSFLDYRPEKPVLITVMLPETPTQFIPGPHGYMAEKNDIHKICIPFSALDSHQHLLDVIIHEYAHSAEHDLSDQRCPWWLAEGLSMHLAGQSTDPLWTQRLQEAVEKHGLVPLWGIDGLLTSRQPRQEENLTAGYAYAADAVRFLVERHGPGAPGRLLRALAGGSLNRAFHRAIGIGRLRFEFEWRRDLARRTGVRFIAVLVWLKLLLGN